MLCRSFGLVLAAIAQWGTDVVGAHDNIFALPRLEVRANSSHELGYKVGTHFGALIRARYASDAALQRSLLPWSRTAAGARVVAAFLEANEAVYPDHIAELRGLASGAAVSFNEALLMNLKQELSYFAPQLQTESMGPHGIFGAAFIQCSDYDVVRTDNDAVARTFIAHNEDSGPTDRNRTYWLDVRLPNHSFGAYVYAGELPSSAFGVGYGFENSTASGGGGGVAFTLNAVGPAAGEVRVGLARNFVSRDLLDACGWDDALRRIARGGQAVGHSYNLLALNGSALVANVETASLGRSSLRSIKPNVDRPGCLFHANTYTHLQVNQTARPDSLHRMARAAKLPPPRSPSDALLVLGDEQDAAYPIYMWGTDEENGYTLHTALFDLNAGRLSIIAGNPSRKPPRIVATVPLKVPGYAI